MAKIMVEIDDITGTGEADGDYAGHIECESIKHGIDLMVLQEGTSDGNSPTRVEGHAVHGDVVLLKKFDKASVPLRHKCVSTAALGTVTIRRLVQSGDSSAVRETIELGNAQIISVGMYTPPRAERDGMQGALREWFSLEYQSIKWTNHDGNISEGPFTVA